MSNIELIAKDLRKDFGDDLITIASETPDMDIVSTGSISLDYALGVGGLPRGTIIEFLAGESVGKTSLSYYVMKEHQKVGLKTLFINLEGLYDPAWAEDIADLDNSQVLIGAPDPGMATVELMQKAVHSGQFGLIVLDSVGAMINDSEIFDKSGKPGKIQPGGAASLVTSMVSRTMSYARRNGTTILFLNQLRDTIGALYPMQHGPGGRALGHGATVIVRMKNTADKIVSKVDGDDIIVARRIAAVVEKNKVGAPNAVATYMFYNRVLDGIGPGIDKVREAIDLSMKLGIITRAGAYYEHETFGGKIQGQDSVRSFLRENTDAFESIRTAIVQRAREERKSGETSEDFSTSD